MAVSAVVEAAALVEAMAEAVVASAVAKEAQEVKEVLQEVVTGITGKVASLVVSVAMVSMLGAIGNQNHQRLHLHPPALSQLQQPQSLLHPLPQLRRRPSAQQLPLHHPLHPLSLFRLRRIPGPIGHHPAHQSHHLLLLPQLRSKLQQPLTLPPQPLKLIGETGVPLHRNHFQLQLHQPLHQFLWPLLPSGTIGLHPHLWNQFQLQLRLRLTIGRTGVAPRCL